MPAVAYRIYVCPQNDGQPALVMRMPLWWDYRELFQTYRERCIQIESLAYDDSAFLMTNWEALVFDRRCREQFAANPRSSEPFFVEQMDRLKSALSDAKWVIVEAYEWESGLD